MPLIRLPNGNFVRPSEVRSIRAVDNTDLTFGGYCPPRVLLAHGEGYNELIECRTYEDAIALRDSLAAQVAELEKAHG